MLPCAIISEAGIVLRGGTFLSPDTRSEGFLRGLNFFSGKFKGYENVPKNCKGYENVLENCKGYEIF